MEQEQGSLPSCAYAHISSVLEVSRDEITDIWPLKQGLTNESWHFTTPEGEYVYRQPGVGTEDLVDREAEAEALKLARSIGLDGTFIYEDVKQGWKLSRFLVDCRELDARDAEQVACAMRMARTLHESGARLARTFDFYEEGKRFCASWGRLRCLVMTSLPQRRIASPPSRTPTGRPCASRTTISLT